MSTVERLKEKVLNGVGNTGEGPFEHGVITREEALLLAEADLDELTAAADEIRRKFCGSGFDMCTIINGKNGRCSEDCKYCAQSAHYAASCPEGYELMSSDDLLKEAEYNHKKGVLRYSIVTSGKRLSKAEVERVCESIRLIKAKTDIEVCVSFGLLGYEDFKKIKKAGASRVHCNLESSRRYFPEICTTHTYDEKIETLRAAKRAGLSICSGGIMGLGETMEDRIDMVLTARELGVKSIPVNFLNPIKGTPYEDNPVLTQDEARRCVAVFRFIIPDASIRLAGGRGLLGDSGKSCFEGGANAAITGDMLTTSGITIEKDMEMLKDMGFEVRLYND